MKTFLTLLFAVAAVIWATTGANAYPVNTTPVPEDWVVVNDASGGLVFQNYLGEGYANHVRIFNWTAYQDPWFVGQDPSTGAFNSLLYWYEYDLTGTAVISDTFLMMVVPSFHGQPDEWMFSLTAWSDAENEDILPEHGYTFAVYEPDYTEFGTDITEYLWANLPDGHHPDYNIWANSDSPEPVPEPATLGLIAAALTAAGVLARRRSRT